MATKRYRITSTDSSDQDALRQLMYKYLPVNLHEDALDSIEKTGSISKDIFQKAIDNGVFRQQDLPYVQRDFTNWTVNKLPSSEAAYTKIIKDNANEADATDESLQDKLAAYQGLSKTGPVVDPAATKRQVHDLLGSNGIPDGMRYSPQLEDALSEFIVSARRLPDMGELSNLLSQKGLRPTEIQTYTGLAPLQNFLNNQDVKNRVASPLQGGDSSLDVKRIQDILGTRVDERAKTSDEQNFLADTPAELQKSRENFLAEQEQNAGKTLTERVAPSVMAELNTRGLADSPDVISEVARRGASMQAGIEDQVRQLEQQDAQFFADAAFRIQTAKLNQKDADFRSSIDLERQRARMEQQNRFQTTQSKIGSDFELDMLKREQERNLRLSNDQLNFDAESKRNAANAGNLSDIGSSVGSIVGTKIGTKTSSATVNGQPQSPTTTVNLPKVG